MTPTCKLTEATCSRQASQSERQQLKTFAKCKRDIISSKDTEIKNLKNKNVQKEMVKSIEPLPRKNIQVGQSTQGTKKHQLLKVFSKFSKYENLFSNLIFLLTLSQTKNFRLFQTGRVCM